MGTFGPYTSASIRADFRAFHCKRGCKIHGHRAFPNSAFATRNSDHMSNAFDRISLSGAAELRTCASIFTSQLSHVRQPPQRLAHISFDALFHRTSRSRQNHAQRDGAVFPQLQSRIMPRLTRSLCRSGSITVRRAFNTASRERFWHGARCVSKTRRGKSAFAARRRSFARTASRISRTSDSQPPHPVEAWVSLLDLRQGLATVRMADSITRLALTQWQKQTVRSRISHLAN